jgi:molybdate transport system ATP-binding protein
VSRFSVEAGHPLRDFELELSLQLEAGCLALAGPSGAGKSTLLRIVAGLVRPARGRVVCDGETWTDTDAGIFVPPERRACGYLFQDYALFPHLRAWQNVAYPLQKLARGDRRRRAEELLERFGVRHVADDRPDALSGGERQRVALARTLAREPLVLLLDEPLAALDARTRAHAARELGNALREASVPALLVTHDFAEAAQLGDEVAVIDRGRIVQRASPAELAARPASGFVADFLGATVLTGLAREGTGGLTLVDLDGGGTIASTDPGQGPTAASVFPWEVTLEAPGTEDHGTAQNRLGGRVVSLTQVGNRVRVALATPQPLAAEVTEAALRRLSVGVGDAVDARWKATATRLAPL